MICLSPPSLQDSVQALLASFQHADKTVQELYHPQSDRINLTMNHKDGDPVREAINGLVLLRQIDLFLASWQLQNAQSSMIHFIQLVDSDALFNARPERTRNELICSFQCTIARYLWRLPDHAARSVHDVQHDGCVLQLVERGAEGGKLDGRHKRRPL